MLIPIGVAILLASRRVFKIVDRFPLLSLDVPRSCIKALVSIQQLAIILRQCLHTKKKETMEKIYRWQYINCVDLWVKYVCANVEDNDLQLLVYLKYLWSGSPFFWTTTLASESKMLSNAQSAFKFFYGLHPCYFLGVRLFGVHWNWQGRCKICKTLRHVICTKGPKAVAEITLLSGATVEQNVEFVNKKREEVAFSPKDKASAVDSFLQEIKVESKQTPFTQYYTDIIKRSLSRSSVMQSKAAQKKLKKGKASVPKKSTNKENVEKSFDSTQSGRIEGRKMKKGSYESSESAQKKSVEEEKLTTVHHDNNAEDNTTDVSKQVKLIQWF